MKKFNFVKYYLIFIIIIVFFAYINSKKEKETEKEKESFTPSMRALYRPHLRNARVITEGLYNKHSSNVSNIFRKFGIL
jgi:preprotein translocase subunit SecG